MSNQQPTTENIRKLLQGIQFSLSANSLRQLPQTGGREIAFAGRSNAGKSSALNCLTNRKSLARTSKTPGRTQLINVFEIDEQRRLIDLPGYGFAKAPKEMREHWGKLIDGYLTKREALVGLFLIMDIRHPLKDSDWQMIEWCIAQELPVHVLLSKADKLKRNAMNEQVMKVRRELGRFGDLVSVQAFSSLTRLGMDEALEVLDAGLSLDEPEPEADEHYHEELWTDEPS